MCGTVVPPPPPGKVEVEPPLLDEPLEDEPLEEEPDDDEPDDELEELDDEVPEMPAV